MSAARIPPSTPTTHPPAVAGVWVADGLREIRPSNIGPVGSVERVRTRSGVVWVGRILKGGRFTDVGGAGSLAGAMAVVDGALHNDGWILTGA